MSHETGPAIDTYIRDLFLPRDDVLEAALRNAQAAGLRSIQVPPELGRLLGILVQATGARRVLEIGTLGGYSAIHLARALPPDGRLISPSVLTHPFKPMKNVRESQLIQERIDELIVKIVRREGYSDRDDAALIAGFHERLGDQIKIRIVHVDSIPRTNNAKFRWVISQIPPSFAGTAAERVG